MRPYVLWFVVYSLSLSLPCFLSVAHHHTVMTLILALTWHYSLSEADSRRYRTMLTIEESLQCCIMSHLFGLIILIRDIHFLCLPLCFCCQPSGTWVLYYCLYSVLQMLSMWPVKHLMHCFHFESSSITIVYAQHIWSLYSRQVMCKIARQLCEKSITSLQYLKKESATLSRKAQGFCQCYSRCIAIYYLMLNHLLLYFTLLSLLQCVALHWIA